jgi:transcriptional regulator with XRE-family HTH domain
MCYNGDKSYKEVFTVAFANKLSETRRNKQLTQQELAKRIGIGISQMRRYEKGSSSPTLEVIKNLSLTLGISADELIFGNNEQIASSKILDKELLHHFQMISHLKSHDIDVVKTVLESIIVKNKIENILPGKQEADWEEEMREVQHEFRKKASKYSAQEIDDLIDEAVFAVRSEEKHSNGGQPVGA